MFWVFHYCRFFNVVPNLCQNPFLGFGEANHSTAKKGLVTHIINSMSSHQVVKSLIIYSKLVRFSLLLGNYHFSYLMGVLVMGFLCRPVLFKIQIRNLKGGVGEGGIGDATLWNIVLS